MQPSLVVPANGGASARAVARARGGFTEAWHAHAFPFHDGAFHGSVTAVRRLASCQQAKEREHVHRGQVGKATCHECLQQGTSFGQFSFVLNTSTDG